MKEDIRHDSQFLLPEVEELKDFVGADRAFNKVLEHFPGTDVAKSAEWMLKNLNKPLPDFKDLDDLHQQISDESEGSK